MITRMLLVWTLCVAASIAPAKDKPQRVLSIGGSVTEIVYALDMGDVLVARDATSTFPERAEDLPDVGYMRALSPEGVLSTAPDLILADEGAGPPEVIEVLEGASIPIVFVADTHSAEGIANKIRDIGAALGVMDKAEMLAAGVLSELETATKAAAAIPDAERKRVLFILSTQGGRILASGSDTAAAAIIGLAGGVNAVDAYAGYKPLTDEAVAAAAPDVILIMDRGGDHGAAVDDLVAMPSLAPTRAAQDRAVVRMDGLYLLGFGPRTAAAVRDLTKALYDS